MVAGGALCLDQRKLGRAEGTGVATYAANLALAAAHSEADIETLTDGDGGLPSAQSDEIERVRRWVKAALPWPREANIAQDDRGPRQRVVADVFRVAQVHFDMYGRFLRLRSAAPPGVMHWSYPLPLRFVGCPNLVTVHDLIPLLHPDLSPVDEARARRMLTHLRQEATQLVTVSEASRRDIIRKLGWPEDRVTNTYQAIELPEWMVEEAEAVTRDVTAASGLEPGEYMLHVGTVERRKNIGRLIEAYRESGLRCPLVLAGPDGWHAEEELRAAASLEDAEVIRVPWLERSALMGLIRGATALLAPSLAEGFGLPAVEAMALGVPVMTSAVDATGTPGAAAEIAGDGALLVDPKDIRAMAGAMAALGSDRDLRDSVAARGLVRARAFSREAYAQRLEALYAEVRARGHSTA